jgi:murein DD-endopeptidase MepM/ murein hydrolase activator NlpD
MRDEEFKIYDPSRRQRKKRTGVANDFVKIYQEHVDMPMVAKIVEAGRRTDRKNGEWDEERIEKRAEYMDAQARADAANAPRGNTAFAPRDFAAKYSIDLKQLASNKHKRQPLWWAPLGSEERQYQQANEDLSQKDYEDLMAIPERRTVPRDSAIGQPGEEINIGDLGPGSGGGLFPKEPVKRLPDGWMPHPIPVPITGPGGDRKVPPLPRVIRGPGDIEKLLPHPFPRQEPGKGPVKERPFEDGIIYRPGVEPRRDQPADGSGNNPVSGGPVFDVPGLGTAYPFPGYVTDPGTGGAKPHEFAPGPTPVSNMQDLIDQIAAAMANNQITGEAAQALIATIGTHNPAVQNMGALAGVNVEAFAGDGSNQFAVQNTNPRAGTDNALRPAGPDTGSVLQLDDVNEESDSRGDLRATLAGQRGSSHHSPHGTKWNKPPDHDIEGWDGEPWDDSRAGFFKDGVKRKLSSRWGWRYLSEGDPKDFHGGIDIAAGKGSEVSSIDGGRVACNNDPDDCPGALVIINNGVFYTYLHIDPGTNFKIGDRINPGDSIGTIADYKPPHLHYARHKAGDGDLKNRIDENSIDPLP